MAKRSTSGLIKYVKFLVDAGAMHRPLWLSAVERIPPPQLAYGRRPANINFPEDEMVKQYYKRNPEATLEPLDLSSFDPPVAKQFALRQLELIQQGVNRKTALKRVKQEFAAAAKSQRSAAGDFSYPKTIIEQIQLEEEGQLQHAVDTYIEKHGHPPLVSVASERPRQRRMNSAAPERSA